MEKTVVLVGHDKAPTKGLGALAKILTNPRLLLADANKENVPSNEVITRAVHGADFVLCGISNPAVNAEMEVAAANEALRLGIPFGFYADAKGAWSRESARKFSGNASLIMTVLGSVTETGSAKAAFPKAKVVCTGNPEWEKYFLPASRADARKLVDAADGEFVVLSPGTKEPVITIQLWAAVIEAAYMLNDGRDKVVILTQHPGDQTPVEMYQLLVDYARDFDIRLIGPFKPKDGSDPYVPGVDAVVGNMNSSVSLHAICRRIGTVDFYGPIAQRRLELSGGGTYGQHYITGAVIDVYTASSKDLADALYDIIVQPDLLKADQEVAHPPLKQGDAVRNMKRAIEEVLAAG